IVADGRSLRASAMPTASSPCPLLTISTEGCVEVSTSPAVSGIREFIAEPLQVVPVQHASQHKICQSRAPAPAQATRNSFHVFWCQEATSGLDGIEKLMHRRRLDEKPDFRRRMLSIEIHRTLRSLLFLPKQALNACRGDGRLNVECDGLTAKHTANTQAPQPYSKLEVFPSIAGEPLV